MAKSKTTVMKKKILIVGALLTLAGFLTLIGRLYLLQLVDDGGYKQRAIDQQLRDTVISAKRGTIFDRNMKALARSATVWTVFLSPKDIQNEEQRTTIVDGLSEILGIDKETLTQKTKKKNYYEIVQKKVELPQAEQIRAYINKTKVKGIHLEEDYKRYYPENNFASTVIGFTGTDNQGLAGLEAYYDEVLAGTPGRVVAAKNAVGTDMPFKYEKMYDAQDGDNLVLTIDSTIQHFLEKNLEIAVKEHNVSSRAAGIVMDVKTGEILGMTTKPDFDPNQPFEIYDEATRQALEALSGDELKQEKAKAQSTQWRNKVVSDLYEPGSVFKTITGSSALEEGAVTENQRFNCPGYIKIGGRTMKCHKAGGHGSLNFAEGMMQSCNPVFITVGTALGADRLYHYIDAYGLTKKTGIDLPGEELSLTYKAGDMGPVEVASCSMGQSNKYTPIQMITAVCAALNGGNLMQPHLVKQITDSAGSVVKTIDPAVKRQVISEQTSQQLALMLERVVTEGGGKNAYIPGYRIGGKSGTSQKLDGDPNARIASFMAFAPVDDPQVAVLCILDEPHSYSVYGSVLTAPCVSAIMADILPYLGIQQQFSAEELEKQNISTPSLVGSTVLEAKQKLTQSSLNSRIIGNGDTVVKQVPQGGETIPRDGTVILYTTEGAEEEMATVPNVIGMTTSQANIALTNAGLNISISGAGIEQTGSQAIRQSVGEGESVPKGTVIAVDFISKEESE